MAPTLTEAQMARIAAHGHVRWVERGDVLVEAGERWLYCYPHDAFAEY